MITRASLPALDRRALLPLATLYAAALAGGALFAWLDVPLPWMIGALVFSAAAKLFGLGGRPPVALRTYGQVVVGVAVGLYFTPEALGEVVLHVEAMIIAAALTLVLGGLSAVLMSRVGGLDARTSFFACIPGGPVEMAILAERAGAQVPPVALAQTLRIAALVLIIPPAITWSGIGGDADLTRFIGEVRLFDLGLLAVAAVVTARLFRLLRVPNPWFLGPTAAGALFAVTEAAATAVPFTAIALGQVCLGTALGSQFDRAFVGRSRAYLKGVLVCTAFLMIACALMGVAVAQAFGLSKAALILATAPGSLTEMCLTAKALDLSVALVTAFHLLRLFIIVPLTPLMFGGLCRAFPRVFAAPPVAERIGST